MVTPSGIEKNKVIFYIFKYYLTLATENMRRGESTEYCTVWGNKNHILNNYIPGISKRVQFFSIQIFDLHLLYFGANWVSVPLKYELCLKNA